MNRVRVKKLWIVLLGLGILFTMVWPVTAAPAPEVRIVVDEQLVTIPATDQAAFILQGRTYVPLRVVSERLGAVVDWLPATRQVVITTVSGQDSRVPDRSGSQGKEIQVVVNGSVLVASPGDGQAFITGKGRTVVPFRVVGEALGCRVDWDGTTRTVVVVSNTGSLPPSRGDIERPLPEPENPPVEPDRTLLQELARYKTNLKLLDGSVINSEELIYRDVSSFSDEQLQKFEQAQQLLEKYDANIQLPDGTILTTAGMEIMGPSVATAAQLKAWIEAETPRIRAKMEQRGRSFLPISPELIDLYLRIGADYGIRGDLAFCQAVKETEYFQFTGSVQSWQNNFCGLWATGSPCTGQESLNGAEAAVVSFEQGVHGAIFSSVEFGVEAHIQHLYAYACKGSLPAGKVLCDPRFKLVTRGIAPTWQGLNARWAVPGVTYGQSIIHDYWKKALTGF